MASPSKDPTAAAPDPLTQPGVRASDPQLDVDFLIVGAGISGIGTGIELLRRGMQSFVLLESADDLGGTWRDNTYPGVAVDIPSISYCFSFETDFPWSRVFAPGHEILDYVRHCARKYKIDSHIRYRSRVVRSTFDSKNDRWETELDDGSALRSRYLISATGLFNTPRLPDIPGLESFAGKTIHTARWDHEHELSGTRVGVIGTGASAVQVVPAIAERVAHLEVFQRTPIWVARRPDYALHPESSLAPRRWGLVRGAMRAGSELMIEGGSLATANYRRLKAPLGIVERTLRASMRMSVDDPATAEKLLPNYGLGCKRPAVSNHYLQTFNRPNVRLVTEGIERVCAEGIVTRDGALHTLDSLVLSTGFLTTERGNSPSFEVVGLDDVELGEFWETYRHQAYAGVAVPGFPNFFLTAGPYSGGFNWFAMLQAHLLHIMDCIEAAAKRNVTRLEVRQDAHDSYMRDMWRRAEGSVFKDSGCLAANSYYLDSHGDASLPLPSTPGWRWLRVLVKGTSGYRFGS